MIFYLLFFVKQIVCQESIYVENYKINVAESSFNLFEIYENQVFIKLYPAFYFNEKTFSLGTPIKNLNNKTISWIIGSDADYYPIAPLEHSLMYCGNFDILEMMGNREVIFQSKKYAHINDFLQEFEIVPELEEHKCFVYA